MAGMVYLVGAGPGDYRLISMKAVDCLKMADVVVYDRLADDRILRWAPDDAEYIYVGKASSNHTMKQEDINQLLVDKAKEGKCVVRLKGGDPFVFGRGGEEGLLLRENNLPFEIVPGITSAISVPAYAGIPVTHRAVATSFAVVTGHEDPTKGKSNMRWEHLATGVDTLVFLMGVANLPHITSKLIENGRSADTPAAVIRWGTKPEQRTLVTTVGKAAEDVAKNGIKPPAIFIVGEVVKLRDSLQWFDNLSQRPLFGKRILVTRARSQASKLTAKLENLGAEVFEAPAISMADPADNYAALDKSIDHLQDYHWLIFTSANGVGRFFARLFKAGKDARALGYAKIAAIGSATAEKLHQYGLNADVVPAEYRAEGVLEALKGKLPPHAKILIPRAEEAREILPETLREMGAEVEVAAAYRTVCGQVDGEALAAEIKDGQFDMVTFTSSSTVKNLVEIIGSADLLKDVKTACIGPITADTAKSLGIEPDIVAEEYTIDGLVEAICK
ncbi:uroporphyrinogen-III C-methyltransferase/uroporphyrinogen-III synthase [Selenomonas ruminantium subsp. lactilytica TAM6421]|uniref:uroporphyrinogen-III C-methyltransferase n=1 Tax=Selenomonas ruminantium subsp. lactilytica (strain NBRC 103574 / TAM6421) TaxID=927704 RepID=I0GTK2_SELRL|nr:uroporphyrinogen-III C-methyltransferase [Selenomonas ruminantium]BAL84089.1 uroporphyrinogen-III C-methyltransferase/uroporphyrinogen-III synthase [Selenomonas ruminantium subsp. lactilytica TAM6421]